MFLDLMIDAYVKYCEVSIKKMKKKIKHREIMLEKIQKFVDV